MKNTLSILFFLTSFPANAAFQCPADKPAWHSSHKESDYYLYGDDGLTHGSQLYLEKWTDGKLQWRTAGKQECSNGVSICRLSFPSATVVGENISSVFETVYENDSENKVPAYIVIAAFLQDAYYGGGLKVTSFNNNPSNDDHVIAPNIYRSINCNDVKKPEQTLINERTEVYPLLATYYKYESSTVKFGSEAAVKARISGALKSVYECEINIRTHCQKLLIETKAEAQKKYDNYELYKWGQRNFDQYSDAENEKYLNELVVEAIEIGFNLFSENELLTNIE